MRRPEVVFLKCRWGTPVGRQHVTMHAAVGNEPGEWALFGGGPVDGRMDPLEPETAELTVVMTDGQRHRYVWSDQVVESDSGRRCIVFRHAGRFYGLS